METTMILIGVMCLATLLSVLLSLQVKRRHALQRRKMREMNRTIEKLRSKNGELWMKLMKAHSDSANSELTQTNFTQTNATSKFNVK